jgi:cation diffusion facilitator CzcD-associated flavoprotein CzcO
MPHSASSPAKPGAILSAEEARLATGRALPLSLPGVSSLGPGAAKQLSQHAGSLILGGLRRLDAGDARALGWHRDWLLLDGLESIDAAAAKGLGRHRGGLSLGGLARLDAEPARALAGSSGDLRFDGLRSLTPESAAALASHTGTLHLDSLAEASPATLAALARHAGGLSLRGLTTLDISQAKLLATHRGRLWLDGLTDLPLAVASALAGHTGGLSLAGLRVVEPEVAAVFQPTDRARLLATARLPAAPPPSETDSADPRAPVPVPAVCPTEPPAEPLGVAIIGGGFAGIAMAIGLLEDGRHDFAILEKAPALGGTWRDNTYPGCACDVPSRLYSYSFDSATNWSRDHAPQAEILGYLEQVARRHDVHRFTRFGTAIERIEWDASARLWRLRAADGRRFTARVVVSAVGGIHLPNLPDLPGLADFAGPAFHTARWRHDVDLAGRRVAVIGTGASAIQVVPEIAKQAERLTIYQRTPPWILPRRDRPVSRLARWLDARVPGLRAARRQWLYWTAEARAIPLAHLPRLVVHPQRKAKAFLKRSLPELRLRRKLVPDYALGCKRVLKSDDYFPTLGREHVEVVVEPIDHIGRWGITTADGIERPTDAIVLATGFKPFDLTDALDVVGRDGRSLRDAWRSGPEAFRGVAVTGFPNLFLLMGPNTALGHNSILVMIEAQVNYIRQCLGWIGRGELGAVEVTPAAQAAWMAALHDRFERSVWRSGPVVGTGGSAVAPCGSWYRHASGRNHVIWPGTSVSYAAAMRRAEPRDFLGGAGPAAAAPMRRAA